MNISCLIVEDRPEDFEILESYIRDIDRLELKTHFNNVTGAREFLLHNQVDLIFCDIMIGDADGLSFIRSLDNPPQVIFTTSFPNFAVTGFELNATDYLVKPYTFKRFAQAVNKAIEKHDMTMVIDASLPERIQGPDGHFFIRSEHNIIRIAYNEVIYVEGLKDYVKIITKDQTYLSAMHLKIIEEQLPSSLFIRIHRSFIVNIDKIDSLNNYEIIANGKSLPLGESYKEHFYESVVNKKIIRK